MKRDLDLIRSILARIEDRRDREPFGSDEIRVINYDSAEVAYNLNLLRMDGYLDVPSIHQGMNGQKLFVISGLTNKGHDYLAAVHNPKIWQRVKDLADQQEISLTMDVAKTLSVNMAKQALRIPQTA